MEQNNSEQEEFIEIIDASSSQEDPSVSEPRRSGQSPYVIPAAIVIAGILIAGAVMYSNRGASDTAAIKNAATGGVGAPGSPPSLSDLAGDAPFLGSPKAPVTVVEFADFQCPFCGRFFQTVESPLIDQYVKTGKVRFVYRNFAFLGPESEDAAAAAACAGEQGKFWEYHDYLFGHQQGENEGTFAKANLKKFARAVAGIDGAKFDPCLDQGRYMNAVRADTAAGKSYGVNGTPATFINGRLVSGAQPIAQFVSVIEEELKKSR